MKFICVGRNYAAHAKELGNKIPEEPVIFLKPDTALLRNDGVFFLPAFSENIHYEGELVFRISKDGKNISERFASSYIDAVTIGIDFTARDWQNKLKDKGLPWELSKAFDSSAAVGEFIPLDAESANDIFFRLDMNGKTVQSSSAANMIFSPAKIISYVSKFITLRQGDMIFTGTPEGVGSVKTDDEFSGFIGDKQLLSIRVK
ncbi:MAG TPA: fumarylacetoacetate hydrolase family protein [Bacteroidia bacterium]|nr:fumarylacetoacetate hydrolase family protein [Bacteroidia bacterium]